MKNSSPRNSTQPLQKPLQETKPSQNKPAKPPIFPQIGKLGETFIYGEPTTQRLQRAYG
jgi:hypothetical protein